MELLSARVLAALQTRTLQWGGSRVRMICSRASDATPPQLRPIFSRSLQAFNANAAI
jgi:hypothetical protein